MRGNYVMYLILATLINALLFEKLPTADEFAYLPSVIAISTSVGTFFTSGILSSYNLLPIERNPYFESFRVRVIFSPVASNSSIQIKPIVNSRTLYSRHSSIYQFCSAAIYHRRSYLLFLPKKMLFRYFLVQ